MILVGILYCIGFSLFTYFYFKKDYLSKIQEIENKCKELESLYAQKHKKLKQDTSTNFKKLETKLTDKVISISDDTEKHINQEVSKLSKDLTTKVSDFITKLKNTPIV